MIRLKRGAQPELKRVDLGRGVVLIARSIDSITLRAAAGEAARELEAIRAAEETMHPWAFSEGEIAGCNVDAAIRDAMASYMRSVLQALRSAEGLEGVRDDATGELLPPDFDTLSLLMRDAVFETTWHRHVLSGATLYEAEKNVSGRAPDGPGDLGSNIAQGAAPQEIHARPGIASKASTANGADVPSTNTLPAPSSAPDSGISPNPADAGSGPESPDQSSV